jgi:hypothetical protein
MSEEPPEAHPSRPLSQLQLKRLKFLASVTAHNCFKTFEASSLRKAVELMKVTAQAL